MIIPIKQVNPNKLHDEFINAQINVIVLSDANEVHLRFEDDVDMELVQSIISAHVPSNPLEMSELDNLRDYVLDMELRTILKDLEA